MSSPNLLRIALTVDALSSGISAALFLLGASALTGLFGLPEELMRVAGIILLPFVALVSFTAAQARPSEGTVWAIILINVAWVLGSVALLVSGYVSPTTLGTAMIVAQAAAVGIFADLQYFGLQRARKLSALG